MIQMSDFTPFLPSKPHPSRTPGPVDPLGLAPPDLGQSPLIRISKKTDWYKRIGLDRPLQPAFVPSLISVLSLRQWNQGWLLFWSRPLNRLRYRLFAGARGNKVSVISSGTGWQLYAHGFETEQCQLWIQFESFTQLSPSEGIDLLTPPL